MRLSHLEIGDYFSAKPILSHGAMFNFIDSNRNYGKTWAFKKRAVRRAFKRGKKTIWIRVFNDERKECARNFFSSRDLREFCGVELWSKENPEGNIKQEGPIFYYRKGKKWEWFLKVISMSDRGSMRGVDDVDVDTFVFDEYNQTVAKMSHYRGSIVDDFLDIWASAEREHQVRCFFLGNRESVSSPFYTYFSIAPPFEEGIRLWREGTVAVQWINNPLRGTDYAERKRKLLKGTQFGSYLEKGKPKGALEMGYGKAPHGAIVYMQLHWKGRKLRIRTKGQTYYIDNMYDLGQPIYCDNPKMIFPNERILLSRQKKDLLSLQNAVAGNRIVYKNAESFESASLFFKWLGVTY